MPVAVIHHRALLARLPAPGEKTAWRLVHAHPVPSLKADQVRIRTTYVALNPYDWQGVEFKFGIGPEAKVMGRDGAGIVVDVGAGVTDFHIGDRVWFCADSSVSGTGAFQEFSVHSACNVGHTPDNLTDEQAATLGTGLITAGVALFRTLGLSIKDLERPKRGSSSGKSTASWILIWGGSGITGVYLIQLAHYLGYRVVCAASPENHTYVKSLGADVVLDRWASQDSLVEDIRKATGDDVRIAIDNVGKRTATLCRRALRGSESWRSRHGLPAADLEDALPGRLVPLAGNPSESDSPEEERDAIRDVQTLRISFSTTFYSQHDFASTLLGHFASLLEQGHIKPARIKFVEGGLEGIEKGLDDLRHNRVPGGYKLVAKLSDHGAAAITTLAV